MEGIKEIRKRKMEDMARKHKAPAKPVEVNDSDFESAVSSGVVVVDLWAEWCMPCRMLGPAIEQLAEEMSGKAVFAKMDVDRNRRVPAKFGVMSIPTLLFFKDGKLADKLVGAVPKQAISDRIHKLL